VLSTTIGVARKIRKLVSRVRAARELEASVEGINPS